MAPTVLITGASQGSGKATALLSQKLGLKPRPYRTALLAEVKTLNLFHKDM
ncbi:MAG: hypothetical protein ACM65L_01270 [Microcoleus sp.]